MIAGMSLKEVFSGKDPEDVFTFTNAQMISYFVVRMATDGNPASDVKAMNKSATQFISVWAHSGYNGVSRQK